MSERSATDFTGIARDAKNSLDSFFQIPLREYAISIVKEMRSRNTNINASILGDLDKRLLSILSNDEKYLSENFKVLPDKTVIAKSLFEKSYEEAKSHEDEKPYENRKKVSMFDDIERNAATIDKYDTYVKNLKSVDELDELFFEKLNVKCSAYKSSTDYMTRLVRRLLKYNFNYKGEFTEKDTTRLLILKQFLKQFGYNCVDEIKCTELQNIVESEYEGNYENISDDIFRHLSAEKSKEDISGIKKTKYDDNYVGTLVKFQGIVIYKSSVIRMTKELCEKLCDIVCEKTDSNEIVLTSKAIDGTAKTLNECFEKPETFSIAYFKDYKDAEIEKVKDLNSTFTFLCRKELEASGDLNRRIILTRAYVLFYKFADKILVTNDIKNLIKVILPDVTCIDGVYLSKCIKENDRQDIKKLKTLNSKEIEKFNAVVELLKICESKLNNNDWEEYVNLICTEVKSKYADAVGIGELLDVEIANKIMAKKLGILLKDFGSDIEINKRYQETFCLYFSEKKSKKSCRVSEFFENKEYSIDKLDLKSMDIYPMVEQFIKECEQSLSDDTKKNYHNRVIDEIRKDDNLFAIPLSNFYSDVDVLIRLIELLTGFADKIWVTEDIRKLLSNFISDINYNGERMLDDYLKSKDKAKIGKWSWSKERLEKKEIIKNLVEKCEEYLDDKAKKDYIKRIHDRIRSRENEATKSSVDKRPKNLWKQVCDVLKISDAIVEYKLLKISDDLANAKFNKAGKTREYLYIFAIAFGMTSSGYDEDREVFDAASGKIILKEDPRKFTDIQKNLFLDYYADNFVNVALQNTKKADGYGINYKNFAEVAFLWSINQSGSAADKLKLAYEIIEYCKANNPKRNIEIEAKKENCFKITEKYKDKFLEFLNSKESDIKSFLVENYSYEKENAVMAANSEAITARIPFIKSQNRVKRLLKVVETDLFYGWDSNRVIQDLIDRDINGEVTAFFVLRNELREKKCEHCQRKTNGIFPDCYSYFEPYFWIDERGNSRSITSCSEYCLNKKHDKAALKESLRNLLYIGDECEADFEKKMTSLSELCSETQTDLKEVLTRIESSIKISVLDKKPEEVSRTSLIALCYFEMVFMNYLYRSYCESKNKVILSTSFAEFYKFFCEGKVLGVEIYDESLGQDIYTEFVFPGADAILSEAGYQRINSKNILDVYIIFLAFRDNYKKLYSLPDATDLIKYAQSIKNKLRRMKKEIEENRKNENNISKNR